MKSNNFLLLIFLSVIIILLGVFGPFIVEGLFELGETSKILLSKGFIPDQVLEYFGAFISTLGTVFLGVIAYWQNMVFQKENDKAQEKLKSNIEDLVEINKQLNSVTRASQQIQLLLSQEYIPRLVFEKIISKDVYKTTSPQCNLCSIQVCEPRYDVNLFKRVWNRLLPFTIEMTYYSVLSDYDIYQFELYLTNDSKAEIESLKINYIKFFTDGHREFTLQCKELTDELPEIQKIRSMDLLYLMFSIIAADQSGTFSRNIEIGLKFITLVGLEFNEVITITNVSDPTISYRFDNPVVDRDY